MQVLRTLLELKLTGIYNANKWRFNSKKQSFIDIYTYAGNSCFWLDFWCMMSLVWHVTGVNTCCVCSFRYSQGYYIFVKSISVVEGVDVSLEYSVNAPYKFPKLFFPLSAFSPLFTYAPFQGLDSPYIWLNDRAALYSRARRTHNKNMDTESSFFSQYSFFCFFPKRTV